MVDRTEMLLRSIDVTTGKGLELGPLTKPIVSRDAGTIHYLDHVGTDALRARYASHDGFDIEAIVPIDFVIGDGTIQSAVGATAPFDYVVASHVIEHVPNLVGWLHDVRSVLADDGVLSLAIPDHRRCFDALRSPTVAADLMHAHLVNATTPSPRQVFDHYFSAVAWHGQIAWGEEPPITELVPVHSEQEAAERATDAATTGGYDDVHCWVFTPRSFCRVIAALQRQLLVPFSIEHCSESVGGEFFVRMRVADPELAVAPTMEDRSPRITETAALRVELGDADRARAVAMAEVEAMKRSRSWQLTRPLRRIAGRRGR